MVIIGNKQEKSIVENRHMIQSTVLVLPFLYRELPFHGIHPIGGNDERVLPQTRRIDVHRRLNSLDQLTMNLLERFQTFAVPLRLAKPRRRLVVELPWCPPCRSRRLQVAVGIENDTLGQCLSNTGYMLIVHSRVFLLGLSLCCLCRTLRVNFAPVVADGRSMNQIVAHKNVIIKVRGNGLLSRLFRAKSRG